MKRQILIGCIALLSLLTGCATKAQFLAQNQQKGFQAALSRAQFDMNCPNATGSVLSQEVIQPPFEGRFYTPPERAEYTIGIEGCGKKVLYLGICPQGGDGCFAFPAKHQ